MSYFTVPVQGYSKFQSISSNLRSTWSFQTKMYSLQPLARPPLPVRRYECLYKRCVHPFFWWRNQRPKNLELRNLRIALKKPSRTFKLIHNIYIHPETPVVFLPHKNPSGFFPKETSSRFVWVGEVRFLLGFRDPTRRLEKRFFMVQKMCCLHRSIFWHIITQLAIHI